MNAHGRYMSCPAVVRRIHTAPYAYDCPRMGLLYAMRGLSALSIFAIRAMREPRVARWAKKGTHAFFESVILTLRNQTTKLLTAKTRNMISKGRTYIRAEIDDAYEAFRDILLKDHQRYYKQERKSIEEKINFINNSKDLFTEEKNSETAPYQEAIEYIEYAELIYRKSIFCAIYHFWESKLLGLCKYYNLSIKPKSYTADFLKVLEGNDSFSCEPTYIALRELRNHFEHGSAYEERFKNIETGLSNYIAKDILIRTNNSFEIHNDILLEEVLSKFYKRLCEIDNKQCEKLKNKQ